MSDATTAIISFGSALVGAVGVLLTQRYNFRRLQHDEEHDIATDALSLSDRKEDEIKRLSNQIEGQAHQIADLERANRTKDIEISILTDKLSHEISAKVDLQTQVRFLTEAYQTLSVRYAHLEEIVNALRDRKSALSPDLPTPVRTTTDE